MNKRKESRKDKRIKRLQEELKTQRRVAAIRLSRLSEEVSRYRRMYRDERLAGNKLRQTVSNLEVSSNSYREALDKQRSDVIAIMNLLGCTENETYDKVSDLIVVLRDMLPLVQCPSAPCSCWRDKLATKTMKAYAYAVTSHGFPPSLYVGGIKRRDTPEEQELGCSVHTDGKRKG